MKIRTYASTLLATLLCAAVPALAAQKTFTTPKAAAEALVSAAETFDVTAMKQILGPDGIDLVITEDPVLDRSLAKEFAAKAKERLEVVPDPKNPGRAAFTFGADAWPLPIPVVKGKGGWRFDTAAGREEVLIRRIGRNELDAIQICHGYVEAQHEYALVRHGGSPVNEYAQRVIATPGKEDGLAWRNPDGTWGGPIGDHIAQAIAQGYTDKARPYHGYFFKVLKGQGPSAPLGEMDFVVKGYMIGGFALVAAPADYGVTGVKTFLVSHDGVVWEKDLGEKTLDAFKAMERFDPDESWSPVAED